MTHDPLCHIAQDCSVFLENAGPHNTPFIDDPDLECWCGETRQCGLIAAVRADEHQSFCSAPYDPQWQDETSTHVPPCHQALGHWAGGCQCAVIAQVRAETLDSCVAAVEKLSVPPVGGRWEVGAEAFQVAALHALRGLRQP